MTEKEIDELLDDCASDLLEYLSKQLPEIQDNGEIGELVLLRALEAYRIVIKEEEKTKEDTSKV